MIDGAPALELRSIHKRFGSVVALDGASLAVRPGTVHALLGENGAGKTTLVRVAFGLVRADAGDVLVDGTPRRLHSAADAIAAGVGMVHQHFSLVPALTAAENAVLGGHGAHSPRRAAARLLAVARESGLGVEPEARVEDMPVAAQQRLEILKALMRGARILVLDEPTAVLAPRETEELLAWMRGFVQRGNAAVLITHKLREALAVADEVTVLRRGRTVSSGPASGTSAERLAAAMVGEGRGPRRDLGDADPTIGGPPPTNTIAHGDADRITLATPTVSRDREEGRAIVRAQSLTLLDARRRPLIHEATFTLHRGEIVGVAAVEGSGQHALLRAIAARLRPAAGTLTGPPARDVAFVPEDRHRDALILDLSLTENVALRGAGERLGRMHWAERARAMARLMAEHDVRATGPRAAARTLSGGNQQKLVLARELASAPALVVAENPTRGLDVHATAQVHERLRLARDRGAAVVLYSTDLDEVLALASRVLVVHAGRVRETPPDRAIVGRAMLGVESPA